MCGSKIRTLYVVWIGNLRVHDHWDDGKGFQIENGQIKQNRYSDNPDHFLYHFNQKFDWEKLEALLGK